MSPISKPPPSEFFAIVTDRWTEPFWKAAAAHRLVVPQCRTCGHFRMPPTPFCPHCQSQEIDWVELTGEGTVYSYTIVARAIAPHMEGNIPYVPAVIDLDGASGVRLISNIVGVALEDLAIGRRVRVAWHDHDEGTTIPLFVST